MQVIFYNYNDEVQGGHELMNSHLIKLALPLTECCGEVNS